MPVTLTFHCLKTEAADPLSLPSYPSAAHSSSTTAPLKPAPRTRESRDWAPPFNRPAKACREGQS